MQETYCEFSFDAAHRTTPETPLHGHSFRVRVTMTGTPLPGPGWTHDLNQVEATVAQVRDQIDHSYLNDIPGLETPTLENLAGWLWARFDAALAGLSGIEVSRGERGRAEGVTLRRPVQAPVDEDKAVCRPS